AEIVIENQHGDPRYLAEARKALADYRKVWGLDAPQRLEVRPLRNPYADLSDEELQTALERQAQLLSVTTAPHGTTPAEAGDPDREAPIPRDSSALDEIRGQ